MKTIKEIKGYSRIRVLETGIDGGIGIISLPKWAGSVIWSNGAGWEHVSVSPYEKRVVPSWDDMCVIKDVFWNDDEAVIQVHPAKADYVNNLRNCLHLWRCTYKEMVLPPSCLVGIKDGQTQFELEKEYRAACEMAGERCNG